MRVMFDEVKGNKVKSLLLVSIFIIVIGLLGAIMGLTFGNLFIGLFLAVLFSVVYSLICYYSGDSMILSLSGAKPVTKKDYPYLFHTVEGLSIAANLKHIPKAYVIEDSAMNAFATGRDAEHASIAVTTGLLKSMNRQELDGVVAHEMAHIRNYDIRFMMLTAVLVGIVTLLSDFLLRSFLWRRHSDSRNTNQFTILLIVVGLLFAVLSPIIGKMIQLAISRKREFMADASAAVLTRYPSGLASALMKISKDPDPLVDRANRSTAHLFISTPFRKDKDFITGLFATHPPIHERIKRLEEM